MKKVLSVFASTMMVLSNVFLPVSAEGETPPAEDEIQEEVTEAPEPAPEEPEEGSETGEEALPDPASAVIQEEEPGTPEEPQKTAEPEEPQETAEPENSQTETDETLNGDDSEGLSAPEEETIEDESEGLEYSYSFSDTSSSDKNAYTFFIWLSENTSQSQAVRDSAAVAARLLKNELTNADLKLPLLNDGSISSEFTPKPYSEIISYTSDTIGNDGTATSWENFKFAVERIALGNEYRARESLAPLTVSSVMMAQAMINANYQGSLPGTSIAHASAFMSLENLASNYKGSGSTAGYPDPVFRVNDPYDGWYTGEKKVYDYAVSKNWNPAKLTSAQKTEIQNALGIDAGAVQTGHYMTLTDRNNNIVMISSGMGYINSFSQEYDDPYYWTRSFEKYSQTFGFNRSYTAGQDGISVSDYQALIEAYESGSQDPVAVTGVTLNKTSLSLNTGNSETLTATVLPADASNKKVTWSSNKTGVATVDNSGKVTAVAAGTATITVTTEDGNKTASCTVTVTDPIVPVTGVTLNKTSLSLNTGNSETLTATVLPADASNKKVTWTSNKTGVATVDNSGKVTAVAAGTATITVTTEDGNKTASCTVTVTDPIVPVTGVTLNKTSLSLNTGNSETLTATVLPANASNKKVTWTSNKTGVATVDSSGKVTAVAAGTATITVTTEDGNKTASCTVTVTDPIVPVTGVTLNKTSLSLNTGSSETLTATVLPADASNKKVTWTSNKTGVATVDSSGKVTAVAAGTATITVTTEDGNKTASCTVTVTDAVIPVTGVSLDRTSLTLVKGLTDTLTATVLPANASNKKVTWSSNKTSVATVDQNGNITAVAAGTATITVTTQDGNKKATCAVTVNDPAVPVSNITVDPDYFDLAVGKSRKLTATVSPADATNKKVIWSSSDSSIATVSQDGTVTGKAKGYVEIHAASEENPYIDNYAYVRVYIPVTSMKFAKEEYVVDPFVSGNCIEPIRTPSNSDEDLSYSSSDPTVAEVYNVTGMIKPLKVGSTTITAANMDKSITASYKLTVSQGIESAVFDEEHMDAYVGAYMRNNLTVNPSSSKGDVRIESSDKNVVTTFADNVFKAVAPGTATITATDRHGRFLDSYTVTVTKMPSDVIPVESVTLRPGYSYITVGETAQQEVLENPNNANYHYISYGTEDPDIAAIDKNGVITGVAPGRTRIYADSISSYRTYAEVVVIGPSDVRVTGLKLDKESAEIEKNGSVQLTAIVSPANAAYKDIHWYSDRPYITIDETGLVTSTANGHATVYAVTKDGGFAAECKIDIPVRVEKVELNKTKLTLEKGNSETLTASITPGSAENQKVTWSSSKPAVATVDENGKVTAVSKGSAVITVTTEDGGKTASCNVTVTDSSVAVTGVSLNKSSLDLAKGSSEALIAEVSPAKATNKNVSWSSDNLSVATVSEDGTVTAVAAGTAVITVTTEDGGKTASCTVNVTVKATEVTLNKTELSLNKGQTETLTAEVLPEDATEKTLTWSSRNPAVASVDQNGKITAKSGGTTVITAAVKGSAVKAECTVTVLAPVEAVKFSSDAVSVPLENTKKLSYAVLPEDATNKAVTFSSNDSSVASVDDNGVVTGHKLGASAVITVRTMDGNYTDQCTVTVVEEGLIVVGLEDHYKYTGSPIRPAVQVYYDGELLTEKTDYTISYVNNTNAAKAEDEVKAPAVVIKGTGNFVKEARETFTIDPIDMDEVSAEAITLVQSAKAQVLKPKVTWKGKTLKLNTDYSVNQQALNPAVPGEYNVILSGTGNFDKNTSKILVVTVAANNKDVVPVTKLKVSSKAVKYDDIRSADDKFAAVLNASGFAVKNGQTILSEEDDYEILTETAEGCEQAGTCTFVIKGREGSVYRGEKTVSIKINGTSISKAKPNKNAVYTGNAVTLEDQNIGLISGNMPLIAGEDYVIVPDSYEANINAGKASVMVEGRGAYMGRARISFTINPDTGKKTVDVKDTVFAKGGAIPEVTVMNHDNTVLQQGRDYTLKFSNNKGIGTGSVSVTFKGNYKGSTVAPAAFRITKKNLSEVYITAPDLASKNNNKGNFKGKITLTDLDGKKLGSSDYTIVEYRRGIEILNKDSMINEGDVITAVIVGKGSYEGTATVSYSVVQTVLDLSKATIAVAPQIYTGEPIEIGEGDITAHTIKVGKVKEPIEYGTDYKVLYYENNVNKGKAKVTFIGMGRCSGIKTVTFSIAQRDVNTRVSAGAEYFAHAFGF